MRQSLWLRRVAIFTGNPELNAVKEELSILPSIDFMGTCGTNLSPLGPKHTIELPWTEGMSPSLSSTSDRFYSQFTTEVVQGKRSRFDAGTVAIILLADTETTDDQLFAATTALQTLDAKQRGAKYGPRGSYDQQEAEQSFDHLLHISSARILKTWFHKLMCFVVILDREQVSKCGMTLILGMSVSEGLDCLVSSN
ncbi:hypothetical protein C8R48DRAFT_675953 [Suillus tomentosus]|nr:hypothetical protein C8R48DRAFT_675953 [Suillus tomentosus]